MCMKKGKLVIDSSIVGLALFATIFGAGNLVFPPILGLTAGTEWVAATLGLLQESSFLFWVHGQ